MSPITGAAEELMFNTRADHQAVWVHRLADETTSPQPLVDALKKIKPQPGAGIVWIAAEARVARAARDYVINIRRHPVQWLRATGYWVAGRADAYERLDS